MKVNGTSVVLENQETLYDFLIAKKYNLTTIAVERNGEIVPKSTYQQVQLKDEDQIEIVRFVGGG